MMDDRAARLESLWLATEAAAAERDFGKAANLRDRVNLSRAASPAAGPVELDHTGLDRQKPGAMGLGTSQQRMTQPSAGRRPASPIRRRAAIGAGRAAPVPDRIPDGLEPPPRQRLRD